MATERGNDAATRGLPSALDSLTQIPEGDRAALRKFWQGDIPSAGDLGQKTAVLVIDMTDAFVRSEYPTGDSETGEPCAHNIAALLSVARQAGWQVIYTVTEAFDHPALIGGLLRGQSGPSPLTMFQHGDHHDVVTELQPESNDIVLVKPKPSAFFATQLNSILNYLDVDSVIVTGMTTSGCVRATVNDAFMLNYNVIVPVECVADRARLSHEVELFDMGAKYADVVHTADLIEVARRLALPVDAVDVQKTRA